ncbi:hypothetical protein D3C87_1983080 [compost metagenome]
MMYGTGINPCASISQSLTSKAWSSESRNDSLFFWLKQASGLDRMKENRKNVIIKEESDNFIEYADFKWGSFGLT